MHPSISERARIAGVVRLSVAITALAAILIAVAGSSARTQDAEPFLDAADHPAINYRSGPTSDRVGQLAARLAAGAQTLEYDNKTGYLPSLLRALEVPIASQLAVFSKTSLQQSLIQPQNPRAIYFNDAVSVAWPRGGFIEITAEDPRQGVVFYVMPQGQIGPPAIIRRNDCLSCHNSYGTLGVPGLFQRSVVTGPRGEGMPFLGNYLVDDRTPLEERWAGWFVTGSSGTGRHLGNQTPPLTREVDTQVPPRATAAASFAEALDGYLSPQSDIVAHLVFDHQLRVVNLLTRTGWGVRLAQADRRDVTSTANALARELVDALLFVDEAPLPAGIAGDSAFADTFTRRGPVDARGRSLRTFDLHGRLMRFPCSFMVYADAFDALPQPALDAVYRRLWAVLSGEDNNARYARLTPADRRAVVEILRDTKKGLPEYFKQP